jgi:hypothetical protein
MHWRRKHRQRMCLTFRGASPPDPPWADAEGGCGVWMHLADALDGVEGALPLWADALDGVEGALPLWADALDGVVGVPPLYILIVINT